MLPSAGASLDHLREANKNDPPEWLSEYTFFGITYVVLGELQGVVVDFSKPVYEQGVVLSGILMLVIDGKTAWAVGCGSTSIRSSKNKETCNKALRTFRILP